MCVLNQLSTGQFPCQALQPGCNCLICSQGPVEWTYTLTSKVLFNGLTLIHTTHRQDMTHCTLRCPKKTSCHWIQLTTYQIMYFTSYNGNYNGRKLYKKILFWAIKLFHRSSYSTQLKIKKNLLNQSFFLKKYVFDQEKVEKIWI